MNKIGTMSEIEFMSIFGDNLRDLIDEVGIGQRELAKEIGVTHSTINYYIHKKRMPSLPVFINLCIALDCNPDDLVPMYDYIL